MRTSFFQAGIFLAIVNAYLFTSPALSHAAEPTLFEENFSLITAVRYTVAHQSNIKMEKSQVNISLGALQIATGQFDTSLSTIVKSEEDDTPFSEPDAIAIGHAHQQTQTYSLSQSLNKTFRYGTSIDGSIGIKRTDNRYPVGTEDTDNGVVSFSLTQPLLKGRGSDVTGATELAKKQLYLAEMYTLRRTVSQNIYETVTAYWNYLGALEKVRLYGESIQAINDSIKKLQELIDGDEKPASDMNNYLANLASRKIDLLSAKQELVFSAQTLAVAMGIPYTQDVVLPPATSGFPDPDVSSIQASCKWLTDMALAKRNDLAAQEKNLAAAKYMLDASRNGLLPQLDLALNIKYSDVFKGEYEQDSTSASAWLNYEIPIENNVATGQMLVARAKYNQIQYQIEGLKRTICSQLNSSLDALKTYSYIKNQYESTQALYEQQVKDERIQYSLGTSNLLLVISVEDSLTSTRINLVSSKVNLANALIQLRYATGTVLAPDTTTYHLDTTSLTTVPKNVFTSIE